MNKTYECEISTPFRMVLAGPTGSGKTQLVRKLLKRPELFYPKFPKTVNYFFNGNDPPFQDETIRFYNRKPTMEDMDFNTVIIVDDWMNQIQKHDDLSSLFTVHSRHNNVSVFLMVQNFFHPHIRTLTLNASHIVLFKNPRDTLSIQNIARQMFPKRTNYLVSAYADATTRPHGYLVINTTQKQDEDFRLTSSFLPEEMLLYLPLE